MAHWGNYEWFGGQEKAGVRAFWLFDRTGDPTLNHVIATVTNGWNAWRSEHPELPYIGVYRDDANVGKCFVNRTPGWSIASACINPMLRPNGIKGISATHGSPHFLGGSLAISAGLSYEDAFTAVCHHFGHVLGLADSSDNQSCMSHNAAPGQLKWYGQGDADAILALYGHGDGEAPTAVADTYGTTEDTQIDVPAPGVLANDSVAGGGALTAVVVGTPANGALTLAPDGSFTYLPDAGFDGTDTFTYMARSGGTDSSVTTVEIVVAPDAEVPVAVDDSFYITEEDTRLGVPGPEAVGVLDNDSDPGGIRNVVKVTDPAHGAVILSADGSFYYTPAADFNGVDSFTYKINNGSADSNVALVEITVRSVNDAPVAGDDSYTTVQGVPVIVPAPGLLANDSDVEGDALEAWGNSDPAHGSEIVNRDGSFSYIADLDFVRTDTFTYLAGDGPTTSEPATVTITVTAADGR